MSRNTHSNIFNLLLFRDVYRYVYNLHANHVCHHFFCFFFGAFLQHSWLFCFGTVHSVQYFSICARRQTIDWFHIYFLNFCSYRFLIVPCWISNKVVQACKMFFLNVFYFNVIFVCVHVVYSANLWVKFVFFFKLQTKESS